MWPITIWRFNQPVLIILVINMITMMIRCVLLMTMTCGTTGALQYGDWIITHPSAESATAPIIIVILFFFNNNACVHSNGFSLYFDLKGPLTKKKLPGYLPEHSVKHLQQEDLVSNYFDTLCPHLSIDHSRAMSEFDELLQAICLWKTWNKKIQYWTISRILFTSINKCYTCRASVDKNVMNCLKRSGFCDSSPLW